MFDESFYGNWRRLSDVMKRGHFVLLTAQWKQKACYLAPLELSGTASCGDAIRVFINLSAIQEHRDSRNTQVELRVILVSCDKHVPKLAWAHVFFFFLKEFVFIPLYLSFLIHDHSTLVHYSRSGEPQTWLLACLHAFRCKQDSILANAPGC